MATLSVKEAILRPVLRAVKQETNFKLAGDRDYDFAFNALINMMNEWRGKPYVLFTANPQTMNDPVGTEDPINLFINGLTIDVAPQFGYIPTIEQKTLASSSVATLSRRVKRLPTMRRPNRMPRGSGNYFRGNFVADCYGSLLNESEVPLLTESNNESS